MLVLFASLLAIVSCRLVAKLVDSVTTAFFAVLEWFTDWLFARRDLKAPAYTPARPADRVFAHGALPLTVICLFGNLVALHELFIIHLNGLFFFAPIICVASLIAFLVGVALVIYLSAWFSYGLRRFRRR